jgi:hypothetical protein
VAINKGASKALEVAAAWVNLRMRSSRLLHDYRRVATRKGRGPRLKDIALSVPSHGMLIDEGVWADQVCEDVWVQYERRPKGLLISVVIKDGETVWSKECPYLFCSIRDRAGRNRMIQTIIVAFREAGDACLRLHAHRPSTRKSRLP